MGSAIRIRNGIGEGKNLIVIAIVILENDVHENLLALAREHDWFRVNDLFVFPELFYEFFDPMLVEECLFLRRIRALIR